MSLDGIIVHHKGKSIKSGKSWLAHAETVGR